MCVVSQLRPTPRSALRCALAAALAACLAAAPTGAKVYLTAAEALGLAFPGCEVERGTVFLTEEQVRRAEDLAGVELLSKLVHPYEATCDGDPGGVAYFDTHRVRTLAETLLVVVSPAGTVERVEVLAFAEPEDYLPREAWYEQFLDRQLDPELSLKRAIRPVTGATLTTRATADAVRRVLALHQVVRATRAEGDS